MPEPLTPEERMTEREQPAMRLYGWLGAYFAHWCGQMPPKAAEELDAELTRFDAEWSRLASPVAQEAAHRVEEALREVCPLVNNEGYEDDDEGGPPMYRCLSEDGDAFIETDDPAEVIRAMSRCWLAQQERAEKAEAVAQEAAGEPVPDIAGWSDAMKRAVYYALHHDPACKPLIGPHYGSSAAPIPGEEGGKP